MKREVSPSAVVYGNLPGHRASDNPQSTLPLDLSVSLAHPDLAVREKREIRITELIVCSNTQHGLQKQGLGRHTKVLTISLSQIWSQEA